MLSEELESIRRALGDFLGKLSPDDAETLRRCRRNLDACADQAREMENNLVIDNGTKMEVA